MITLGQLQNILSQLLTHQFVGSQELLGTTNGSSRICKIAESLHDYMRRDLQKRKKESLTLKKESKEAFNILKKAMMTAPVLAYPDPNKEYLLEMDASKLGLGAVLLQKQSDGRYHPVAFGS